MAPLVPDQIAGRREKKKKKKDIHQHFHPRESSTDPYHPSSTCPKISQWNSLHDPGAFHAAASELWLGVSDFICKPFKGWLFLTVLGFPE